jgi:2-amino-4-hydroxy-6-hydroxymethyldihydropteridine diphosphokinase
MKKAYLSLGSNTGNREKNLQGAIDRLSSANLHVLRISSVYETEPMERRDQPWFLNLVAEAETSLFPLQLLQRIQRIEMELGRKRLAAKGPRTIDIDILLYGKSVIRSEHLEVPHPRLAERRFVLEPLAELAPDLHHPETRRTVREMLSATTGQTVRKVSFRPQQATGCAPPV